MCIVHSVVTMMTKSALLTLTEGFMRRQWTVWESNLIISCYRSLVILCVGIKWNLFLQRMLVYTGHETCKCICRETPDYQTCQRNHSLALEFGGRIGIGISPGSGWFTRLVNWGTILKNTKEFFIISYFTTLKYKYVCQVIVAVKGL